MGSRFEGQGVPENAFHHSCILHLPELFKLFIRNIASHRIYQKERRYIMKITKDMTIAQIIQIDQNIIPILIDAGMHCVGCPSAQGESLVEAAFVHGIDVDRLVEDLNQFLSAE